MTSKSPVDRNPFAEHAAACEQCHADPPDVGAVSNVLAADSVVLDASLLSRSIVERLRPELARRAAAVFRRRLATGLVAALVPLPALLLLDAYFLRVLFGLVSLLVPTTLAAYLVISYALFLLVMAALVYGAIPLLVERQVGAQAATTS